MNQNSRRVPPLYHLLVAGFIAGCIVLATRRPDAYEAAMQEDRAVEWATVIFFAAAGVIGLVRAMKSRRVFDGLVALFCLFFAGEEMSWGQRLLGFTPPAYFLAHNTQQELNLHNFGFLFGRPKGPLALVLIGFAALPFAALSDRGRRLLARLGATPPPLAIIPWIVGAIVLLLWYPHRYTGEWVELVVGSAFLVAVGVSTVTLVSCAAAAVPLSVALATWSSKGSRDPARLACAAAEVRTLAAGLGLNARDDLLHEESLHKRVWTLGQEGYVDFDRLVGELATVRCTEPNTERRSFAVDPWGTAYWMRVSNDSGPTRVTVYSFGPNRRRDSDGSQPGPIGDDVVFHTRIPARRSPGA